ncbi:MAG: 5-oxoprolinase subunit PxpB [Geminicoccaceae bacterium]
MTVRFLPCGDTALAVEFGSAIDRAINERVLRLADAVRAAALPGVVEAVPTFRSLLVHYDPLTTGSAELTHAIEGLLHRREERARRTRLWRVPACYEAGHAPDLDEVAERAGLCPAEVVALHGGTRYHVYMIGFVPGFAYMGDLPERLALPRRVDPRVRVPAGSVAIATSMTAIYPIASPGGWHLIGATPIRLFDPAWQPPALLAPGDAVLFEPVSAERYAEIRDQSAAGRYRVPCEEIGR